MSRTVAETLDPTVAGAYVRDVLEQMDADEADRMLAAIVEERRKAQIDRIRCALDTRAPKHGWYSRTQAERGGVLLYARPDGSEVAVTMVTDGPTNSGGFDDIHGVGEVVRFVRRLSGPILHPMPAFTMPLAVALRRVGVT